MIASKVPENIALAQSHRRVTETGDRVKHISELSPTGGKGGRIVFSFHYLSLIG